MSDIKYHLAQANIAKMLAPLDDPLMDGFTKQLEYINRIADISPGFIWRFQTEEGDATALRPFDDETILFNMSVWESAEALHQYVYRSNHNKPLKDRKQWFVPTGKPALVMWWIVAGTIPTPADALERIDTLEKLGPSAEAFTFKIQYKPDGSLIGAPN